MRYVTPTLDIGIDTYLDFKGFKYRFLKEKRACNYNIIIGIWQSSNPWKLKIVEILNMHCVVHDSCCYHNQFKSLSDLNSAWQLHALFSF